MASRPSILGVIQFAHRRSNVLCHLMAQSVVPAWIRRTTQIHQACRRCGDRVAARAACTAEGDAGDRIPPQLVSMVMMATETCQEL